MRLHFEGAAGQVTGSKHLVEIEGKKILLDCGMYQGRRQESYNLNKEFPFNPQEIDAVLLSHAHIDHCGLLPLLYKKGYRGPIYCTPGTADLVEPLMLDSAHIQQSDAKYFSRNKYKKNALKMEPFYSKDDAYGVMKLLKRENRGEVFSVMGVADVTFINAGHVMGSAQVHIKSKESGKQLLFTGDVGRPGRKILKDPERAPYADVVISESTYGGRDHKGTEATQDQLCKIISDTAAKGGKIIIPSFALERTQEILYDLHQLLDRQCIPPIPVFVDSPLATKFTRIFERNLDSFDEETHDYFLDKNKNPFSFSMLKHTTSVEDSKRLNYHVGPCIIISASGMCEAGRIRHHLRNSLPDSRNTILIVGYQAKYTLGRRLVEGHNMVKIFNEMIPVRAGVKKLNGYSGHGDQKELLANITETPGVKQIYLVHGEDDQREAFYNKLKETNPEYDVQLPMPGDEFEV